LIQVKFVEIVDDNHLKNLGNVKLSEAFLPLVNDLVRLPKAGQCQYRVVQRNFWIEENNELIDMYVEKVKTHP